MKQIKKNSLGSNIKLACQLIKQAKHITAFTGAGISVESGIPPFRGEKGLWSKYDPSCLDLDVFHSKPEEAWEVIYEIFYDFFSAAKPNPAHYLFAKLENKFPLRSIITQNIDNLHQEAGSSDVIEFHGTAQQLVCISCNTTYPRKDITLKPLPPKCKHCGTILKPDFIFFGEGIPQDAYNRSFEQAQKADLFILSGTTGEVMPAAMLPHQAKQNGAKIIEINPEASLFTNRVTDVHLQGKAGEIAEILMQELDLK